MAPRGAMAPQRSRASRGPRAAAVASAPDKKYARVAMTTLDWLIVAATALFAVNGYLRGFIVGALSLAGFVAGAIVGTRIADALLPSGGASPYAPVFGLLGAVTAGAILAIGMDGVGNAAAARPAAARSRRRRRDRRRGAERRRRSRGRLGARGGRALAAGHRTRCASTSSAPRSCGAWTS